MNLDKPIAIMLQGPSVSELEDKIQLFKDKDWIWASLNRFQMMEDKILSKIGKELDIVYVTNETRFEEELENIRNFVSKEGKLFITSTDKYDDKFAKCSAHVDVSSEEFHRTHNTLRSGPPSNSITCLLFALGRLGVKHIYLFGCDGSPIQQRAPRVMRGLVPQHSSSPLYYHEELFFMEKEEGGWGNYACITDDMLNMNSNFWDNWDSLFSYRPNIINVNPKSFVTCFEKCSYEQVIR